MSELPPAHPFRPGPGGRAAIAGVGMAIPATRLTNDDLAKRVDTNDAWIVERTGISERRIVGEGETTASLAIEAGAEAIKSADLSPAQIGCCIVATCTPEQPVPATASFVQDGLGLRGGAFDLDAACAGFVYGLVVGAGMLSTGCLEAVLLVGSETLSRFADPYDRSTCILFGDGAGAVVLTPSGPSGPSGPSERTTSGPSGPSERTTSGPSGPSERTTSGPSGPSERTTSGPSGPSERTTSGPSGPSERTTSGPSGPSERTTSGPSGPSERTTSGPSGPSERGGSGDRGLLAWDLGCDGSAASLLAVPAGGSRLPTSPETVAGGQHFLKMEGQEVFRRAVRAVVDSSASTLRQAGVTAADVDLFVPHQANLRIIEASASRLGIPVERTFANIARYGNTSAASIPIALAEAADEGRLRPGSLVLLSGFGAGMSWASALLRWGR